MEILRRSALDGEPIPDAGCCPPHAPYIYLLIAIFAELAGTTALKACEGFSKPWPTVVVFVGYGIAFYFLSLSLRTIPVGVAYAIWSGLGIAVISLIGWFVFKQALDVPAIIGLSLIIAGVVVLNFFSKSVAH